jgi:hypothetical protein
MAGLEELCRRAEKLGCVMLGGLRRDVDPRVSEKTPAENGRSKAIEAKGRHVSTPDECSKARALELVRGERQMRLKVDRADAREEQRMSCARE